MVRVKSVVMILALGGLVAAPAMADGVKGGTGIAGATVIDFEGYAEGTLIDDEYTGVGVDFFTQDDGGTPMIDELPQLFGYGPTSGVNVLTGSTTGGAAFPTTAGMIAEFASPQAQAGAMFSDTAPLGDYTISAYGAGGVLLESFTLLSSEIPSPSFFPPSADAGNGIYVGFQFNSAVIESIQFGPSGSSGDAFAIDDFQFSAEPVPAPGAALLALIGMPVVGWVRRRFA
ncbi:MAG: hypothetical protein HOP29_15035 [Phycisphaerales bacterium]|nr:hypothetical protein [Phycisphaerales bacterium]